MFSSPLLTRPLLFYLDQSPKNKYLSSRWLCKLEAKISGCAVCKGLISVQPQFPEFISCFEGIALSLTRKPRRFDVLTEAKTLSRFWSLVFFLNIRAESVIYSKNIYIKEPF